MGGGQVYVSSVSRGVVFFHGHMTGYRTIHMAVWRGYVLVWSTLSSSL